MIFGLFKPSKIPISISIKLQILAYFLTTLMPCNMATLYYLGKVYIWYKGMYVFTCKSETESNFEVEFSGLANCFSLYSLVIFANIWYLSGCHLRLSVLFQVEIAKTLF